MKSNTASNRDQNIMGTPDRVNAAWGLALAAYCIAKLWFVDGVELGKDEAVYWYWSQHLDASYALLPFSLMALAHALAPYCEWVLRLPSVLLGALSTYLLFALCIGAGLAENRARWAAAAFAFSHWVWHTSSYLHPDVFLVTCWLLALLAAQRACGRDKTLDYVYMGIACGLAVLCKYSGAFLTAGLGLWLLTTRLPQRRWLALAAFIAATLVVAAPLIYAQLSTSFYLPQTLSTLSKIEKASDPLSRLFFFLVNPLFFASPFLLYLLYRAFWHSARTARSETHLLALLPALCTIGAFLFFALYRGQIKGNWILVGFLSLWPLAFALPARRWFLYATVITGLIQALAIGFSLKYPGSFSRFFNASGVDSSYVGLVSKKDRAREPSYAWSERLCEYSGWQNFSGDLQKLLQREGVAQNLPIISSQYSIPFTVAYYSSAPRSYFTIGDPRFRDLTDFYATAPKHVGSALFIARASTPLPPSLERISTRPLGTLKRAVNGCLPIIYQVYFFSP